MTVRRVRTWIVGPGSASTDIALVTQCSLDRLPALEEQAQLWSSSMVAAVLSFDGTCSQTVSVREATRQVQASVVRLRKQPPRTSPLRVALFLEQVCKHLAPCSDTSCPERNTSPHAGWPARAPSQLPTEDEAPETSEGESYRCHAALRR